jgi:hypothetical protein
LSKLHPLPPGQGQSIPDWRAARARRSAAFRSGLRQLRGQGRRPRRVCRLSVTSAVPQQPDAAG